MMNKGIADAKALTEAKKFKAALEAWQALYQKGSKGFSEPEWFTICYAIGDTLNDLDDNVNSLVYYLEAEQVGVPQSKAQKLELESRICFDALHAGNAVLADQHLARIEPQLVARKMEDFLYNLGVAYANYGEADTAIRLLREAISAAAVNGKQVVVEVSYLELDPLLKEARQFEDRIKLADQCLRLIDDPAEQFYCHLNVIDSLVYTNQVDRVLQRWQKLQPLVAHLDEYPEMYQSLYFVSAGLIALIMEEPSEQIEKLFKEAFRISETLGSPIFAIKVAEQIVLYLTSVDYFELARPYGEKAIELARQLSVEEDRDLILAEVAFDQATLLYNMEKLTESEELLGELVYPSFDVMEMEARINALSLGTKCAFYQAKSSQHVSLLDRYKALADEVPAHLFYEFYGGLADLYGGLHQDEAALEAGLKALAAADEQAHFHTLRYLVKNIAKYYDDLGYYEEALATLKSLDLSEVTEEFLADYYLILGDIFTSIGESAEVETAYLKSISHAQGASESSYQLSSAYNNLARFYNGERRLEECLEYYLKSQAIDIESGAIASQAIGAHNIGAAYLDLATEKEDASYLIEAESYLLTALRLRIQRFGFIDEVSDAAMSVGDEYRNTTELYIETLLRLKRIEEAYRYALFAVRVSTQEELAALPMLPLPAPSPGKAIITYVGSRREHLTCFIQQADRPLDAVFIFTEDPEDAMRQKLEQFIRLTQRPGARKRSYWTDLPEMCRYYSARIGDASKWRYERGRDLTRRIGRYLYGALIGDIEGLLGDVDELCIVGDHNISLVPFAALIDADGKWLIERYAISYLSFLDSPAEKITNKDFLLAGATDYAAINKAAYPSLKAGEEEAAQLELLFPKGDHFLNSSEFTGQLDRLGSSGELLKYDMIHLIGHAGVTEDQKEMALFLATEKALLAVESRAISGWQLSASIVFLSACSTGAGQVFAGWGVNSLGRAFLAAGAESVISNLWPVMDQEISVLTLLIYNELLGELSDQAVSSVQRACALGEYGVEMMVASVWSGIKWVKKYGSPV